MAEVTLDYGVCSARLGSKLQNEASSALDAAKAHWRKLLRDRTVATLNGYCMSADYCTMIAQTPPGGLDCYDSTGAKVDQ